MKCSTKGKSESSVTDVDCPSGCRSNFVCGINFYNSNSSVCAAAIHAEILTDSGGAVTFYLRESKETQFCEILRSSFYFVEENTCLRSCQNEGQCLSGINAEFCSCLPGTKGEDCEIDIDECTTRSHNCHHYATCNNTVGSFQCSCNANYTGNGRQCVPDYCTQNIGICRNGATCLDTDISYNCSCLDGYTDQHCETDIDECTSGTHNCHQHATCTNTAGSFQCFCNSNYTGDGRQCAPDFCAQNNEICRNGGTCLDNDVSYSCSCLGGYVGLHCETDIDECMSGTHNCHQYATCINTAGSFQCSCNANYQGDGRQCTPNFCASNPGLCQNSGTCADTSTGYRCSCTVWYTGNNCETVHQDHQLTTTVMTWAQSRSYCQSIGGDLATWGMRDSSTRNSIIRNSLRPGPDVHYWIGLSDIDREGVWKYVDGVKRTNANTDFADGEPNDSKGGQDCARLWQEENYQMDDEDCGQNYRAICERTLN
uniref:Uncharacterized protein LOC104266258 n=1 Tax=Phallusia mammillata TaxID=59560 RepID=A0A6F9DJP8_9ASCI|nr:uncharacterized protein LOC104266258 [Phallusia mammillata]